MVTDLKLGKLPARVGAIKFKFRDFVTKKKAPTNFGHENLFKDWGMCGNDSVGDCVIAGGEHETMLWNGACGQPVPVFTADTAIQDYSALTGYVPGDESTDNGTDMELAAKYRRKTGFVDSHGNRHLIGAYLDLEAGNLDEFLLAAWMFEAVGCGFNMPTSAMDQFNAGKSWSVVKGSRDEGGHYTPLIAKRNGKLWVVTWAKKQAVTTGFFKKYNDEGIVYLSSEMIQNGKSPEGFDMRALQEALASL